MSTKHSDEFADWYGAHWPRVLRAVTIALGDPDLAEAIRPGDGIVDLGDWPGISDAIHLTHIAEARELDPQGVQHSVYSETVQLFAEDGYAEQDLLGRIGLGDTLVDINGAAGLLRSCPSGQVLWVKIAIVGPAG